MDRIHPKTKMQLLVQDSLKGKLKYLNLADKMVVGKFLWVAKRTF